MSSRLPARLRKLPELPAQDAPATWALAVLPADAIEVGRILAPRGVQGEFRVRPHGGSVDVLLATARWFLRLQPAGAPGVSGAEGGIVALDIASVDARGEELSVCATGVTSRAAAEQLRRAAIFVARSDFPALPEGQYYWVDLMGLRVVNREGVLLGVVRDLMETGPSQVLVVAREGNASAPDAQPRLIPFVDAWVDGVDFDARQITVVWQPDY